MATIEYSVAGQQIVVTKDEKLVENTIGIYTVGFTFDAASWGDFTQKTAVFVHEDYPDTPPYEVPIDDGEAPIPAAVLKYGNIMIGVYGSTQTQQYPTIWAPAKRVWPGAGPGVEPPEDPVFGMVVRTAPQELTEEQQEIARTNIGAAPAVVPDSTPGNVAVIGSNSNIVDSGKSLTSIGKDIDSAKILNTEQGTSVLSVVDGLADNEVVALKIGVLLQQSGSDYPSPTNIRPISKTNAVPVSIAKSDHYTSKDITSQTTSGVEIVVLSDNAVRVIGTGSSYPSTKQLLTVFNLTAGKTYRFSADVEVSSGIAMFGVRNASNSFVASSGQQTTSGHYSFTYTIPTSITNFYLAMLSNFASSAHTVVTYRNISITEVVQDITNVLPVADAVNGSVIVSDAKNTFDEEWKYYELTGTENFVLSGGLYAWVASSIPFAYSQLPEDGACSHFRYGSFVNGTTRCCIVGLTTNTGHYIAFYKSVADSQIGGSSVDDFKTYLATQYANGTPVQVAYRLKTVVSTALTNEVKTALRFTMSQGHNDIASSGNDITLDYYADAKLYSVEEAKDVRNDKIDFFKGIIAPVEPSFVATMPHPKNSYFIIGNTLYKASSAIALGAYITVGTNCSKTTIMEEILALS